MSVRLEWAHAAEPVEALTYGDMLALGLDGLEPGQVVIVTDGTAIYGTPQELRAWFERAIGALGQAWHEVVREGQA